MSRCRRAAAPHTRIIQTHYKFELFRKMHRTAQQYVCDLIDFIYCTISIRSKCGFNGRHGFFPRNCNKVRKIHAKKKEFSFDIFIAMFKRSCIMMTYICNKLIFRTLLKNYAIWIIILALINLHFNKNWSLIYFWGTRYINQYFFFYNWNRRVIKDILHLKGFWKI